MNDQPDTLLEAVLALTDPYDEALDEPAKNRWGRKMHHISRPSRIDQLVTAITPSGNSAGGGALARERNIIDTGALDLYRRLLRDVNTAATHVGAPNGDDPAAVLKWWLLTARTKHPTDAFEQEWTGKWEAWARRIDAKLDPPIVVEIEAECPVCQTRTVHDPATGDAEPALTARYSKRGHEGLDGVIIRCANRECGETWEGLTGARACRWEIDQAEARRIETAPEDVRASSEA